MTIDVIYKFGQLYRDIVKATGQGGKGSPEYLRAMQKPIAGVPEAMDVAIEMHAMTPKLNDYCTVVMGGITDEDLQAHLADDGSAPALTQEEQRAFELGYFDVLNEHKKSLIDYYGKRMVDLQVAMHEVDDNVSRYNVRIMHSDLPRDEQRAAMDKYYGATTLVRDQLRESYNAVFKARESLAEYYCEPTQLLNNLSDDEQAERDAKAFYGAYDAYNKWAETFWDKP